ncbi:MAG TPA: periplasmic heavy metal sensor [Terracidiphilus sp.]|nr:periplasmic heavy metal sensor [Terracidiphilus sp.]
MRIARAARVALACVALAVAAGLACAQGPEDGPGGGPDGVGPGFGMHRGPMERELGPRGDHGQWWNSPRMIHELKLTDPQRKAMDKILLDHRENLIDLRANLDKAELMMQPMMREDHPNESEILAQIDKIAMARASLEKANARFLLAIRAQLAPDQWKTLETNWQNRRERWSHRDQRMGRARRMHRRMGPPPPQDGTAPAPAAQPNPDATPDANPGSNPGANPGSTPGSNPGSNPGSGV